MPKEKTTKNTKPGKPELKKAQPNLGFDPSRSQKYYFVSYSRGDAERVAAYVLQLKAHGIPLWYDKAIVWGDDWWQTIKTKVVGNEKEQCLGIFLFLSKNLFQKENSYVFHEFYWAINREDVTDGKKQPTFDVPMDQWKTTIYPIFLDDVHPEDVLAENADDKKIEGEPQLNWSRETWKQVYTRWLADVKRSQANFSCKDESVFESINDAIRNANNNKKENKFPNKATENVEKITLPDGALFTGECWKQGMDTGKVTGRGVITKKKGNKIEYVYTGDVATGSATGKGKMEWKATGKTYEGEFYQNKRHGRGVTEYSEGDRYDGFYADDQKNGHGIYFFKNGDIYDGNFCNGQYNGYGTYTWAGGDTYAGFWENGIKKGRGTLTQNGILVTGIWNDDSVENEAK